MEAGGSTKLPRTVGAAGLFRFGSLPAAGSSSPFSSGSGGASGRGRCTGGPEARSGRSTSSSPSPPGEPFTLRTRGRLSLPGASFSFCVCFLMTSRRIFSLRRVSRNCAHAARSACSRLPKAAPSAARNVAKENCVARITETKRHVATTM